MGTKISLAEIEPNVTNRESTMQQKELRENQLPGTAVNAATWRVYKCPEGL